MKTPLYYVVALVLLTAGVATAQTQQPAKPGNGNGAKPTAATKPAAGKAIYEQYCLACHQVNGSGVPGLNPPLRNTEWVTGDKTRLINVLLKGLQGVEIEGEAYDNAMPAHDFLTDQQLADVLTYIRSNFGNAASAVSPDEVKTVRNTK